MQLGMFAKTFVRPTLGETLDAVVLHGLDCVQFNLSCVGLPTLPERIDAALVDEIRRELTTRRLTMAAVSGTCNLIHPDLRTRHDGVERLKVLIQTARQLGTPVVTLCAGTRDPDDMWRRHPENDSPEAWDDLRSSLGEVLSVAESYNVTLGVEPELGNVVNSAQKARRLLDEIKSSQLKIVMDGANLFHPVELPRMRDILKEAFDLLGRNIVIAHAKDLSRDGEMGNVAVGKGVLDYDCYLSLLRSAGFGGPLILHGLAEDQLAVSVAFIRSKTASSP